MAAGLMDAIVPAPFPPAANRTTGNARDKPRHDHPRRARHAAAHALAERSVAQGPSARAVARLPDRRYRDRRRHHRHGLSVRAARRHAVDRGVPRGMRHPACDRQGRDRGRADLEGALDPDDDLRPRRHRRDGDVGDRHCAVGRGRQARRPAAAPAVGPLPLEDPDLRLGLLPRLGRRRHDREGEALRAAGLQGDQDAGRACAHAGARISTMCGACARRSGPTSTS